MNHVRAHGAEAAGSGHHVVAGLGCGGWHVRPVAPEIRNATQAHSVLLLFFIFRLILPPRIHPSPIAQQAARKPQHRRVRQRQQRSPKFPRISAKLIAAITTTRQMLPPSLVLHFVWP